MFLKTFFSDEIFAQVHVYFVNFESSKPLLFKNTQTLRVMFKYSISWGKILSHHFSRNNQSLDLTRTLIQLENFRISH